MKVSVIIAVFNRSSLIKDLLDCWREIDKVTKYDYEIIFSDDESSDNSVELLNECDDLPIRILKNTHGGAAKARNSAYKHATGEIVIFTGDDIFPEPNFVNMHYESYLKHGENTATLGLIEWREGIYMNHLMKHITEIGCEQFGFVGMKPHEIIDFRHFYTSNISVARKKLEELSCLFDTRFEKYGFEDIELGYRLFKNGVSIYYNSDLIAYHDHVYNSVDKFCKRQLSAGEELNTFKRLHPDLSKDEIKLDIDEFNSLLNNYINNNRQFDIVADFYILGISIAKVLTKVFEKSLAKYDSQSLERLCSVLYSRIFAYYMYLGLANGNLDAKNSKANIKSRFVIRYLTSKYIQIFYDNDNRFSEENSIKLKVLGRKNVDFELIIPSGDIHRLRIDVLNDKCISRISKMQIVNDRNEIQDLKYEYCNGKIIDENSYDFSDVDDPILISEYSESSITKVIGSIQIWDKSSNKKFGNLIKYIKKIPNAIKKMKVKKKKYIVSNKIWIEVKCIEEKDKRILMEYIKRCKMFENVVVSENVCNDLEYEAYFYSLDTNNDYIDSDQFANAVLSLQSKKYDFVMISHGLDLLPIVKTNDIYSSTIISKKVIEVIFKENCKCFGKVLRIPRQNISNTNLSLAEFIENYRLNEHNEITCSDNVEMNVVGNFKFSDERKNTRPVVFVWPIYMAVGGVERNTVQIIEGLKDQFDFVVFTFEKHRYEQGSLFYQVSRLDVPFYDLSESIGQDRINEVMEEFKKYYKPDLIWVCNGSPWFIQNRQQLRRIFRECPIVMQDVYDYNQGWIEYYKDVSIHSFDYFIAINKKIAERFTDKYNIEDNRIRLIYSAMDTSKAKSINNTDFDKGLVLDKYDLKRGKKYFAFVGRFTKQKQVQKILKLAKYIVAENIEDIDFILVGDGELSNECDKLINQYELYGRVHRFKFIENTVEFIKAMDGLLLASLFEGLPIVSIEAMCVGTPVFSTDVGDLPLFINEFNSGYITKSHDIDDIINGFREFYQNLEIYKKNSEKHMNQNIDFFSTSRASELMSHLFTSAMENYK